MVRSDLEATIQQVLSQGLTVREFAGQKFAIPIQNEYRDMRISRNLMDALKVDPRFKRYASEKGAVTLPSGAHGALGHNLSEWLVVKALESNGDASAAIAQLASFIKVNAAKTFYMIALTGIEVTRTTKFEEGFELVNFNKVPDHHFKNILLGKVDPPPPIELRAKPTAALIYRFRHSPVYISNISNFSQRSKTRKVLTTRTKQMHSLSRLLTLIGPCSPNVIAGSYSFEEEVPGAMGMGWTQPTHEIHPSSAWKTGKFSGAEAKKLFRAFEKLRAEYKDALQVPMERLNLSLRRSKAVDRAIELGISLESLLTAGRDPSNAIAYVVRLHGALLAGGTTTTKLKKFALLNAVYDLRSRAVHGDKFPKYRKLSGERQSTDDILWEGSVICADIIRKIIDRGGTPDWDRELLKVKL